MKKTFLKLANNIIFGKTFEKVRKRIDIESICNKVFLTKRISKTTYVKNFPISDNLILIQWKHKSLVIDWSLYLGFLILEWNKVLINNFKNSCILEKYGKDPQLLFSDRGSLFYVITRTYILKGFREKKGLYFIDYENSSKNWNILIKLMKK